MKISGTPITGLSGSKFLIDIALAIELFNRLLVANSQYWAIRLRLASFPWSQRRISPQPGQSLATKRGSPRSCGKLGNWSAQTKSERY
jgi:hypothetical protein